MKIYKNANKHGLLSIALVVSFYSAYSLLRGSPSLPSLKKIFESVLIIFFSKDFYINLAYTIKIVLTGVIISSIAGFVIAISSCMFDSVNELIMPIMNSIKNIPSVALFPLFIVLLGIGDAPRILIIIWNSIYAVTSSTMAGISAVDKAIIEAANLDGAKLWERYAYIEIPNAVIAILNGIKISMGSAFIAIVVAEMLGATKGIGYMILWSANAFKYPDMYVYILVIALIGFSLNVVIEKLTVFAERKLYYG